MKLTDPEIGALAAHAFGQNLVGMVNRQSSDRNLHVRTVDPQQVLANRIQPAPQRVGAPVDGQDTHQVRHSLTPDLAASIADAQLIDDPELRQQYMRSVGQAAVTPQASVVMSKGMQLPPNLQLNEPLPQTQPVLATPQHYQPTVHAPAVDNAATARIESLLEILITSVTSLDKSHKQFCKQLKQIQTTLNQPRPNATSKQSELQLAVP